MTGSNKQQVVFIHGGDSYSRYEDFIRSLETKPIRNLPGNEPLKKWTSDLGEKLGENYEVFTPSMPNKNNAKYKEWKIWFERHFEYLEDDVILVGWSLGGYFLAKYLVENETPFKVKALFLLAPLFENDNQNESGEDGGDFAFDTNQVTNLAKRTDNIIIMHSKDDFVVPFAESVKYKQALEQAKFIEFSDYNHFLIEEFPELITEIKQLSA